MATEWNFQSVRKESLRVSASINGFWKSYSLISNALVDRSQRRWKEFSLLGVRTALKTAAKWLHHSGSSENPRGASPASSSKHHFHCAYLQPLTLMGLAGAWRALGFLIHHQLHLKQAGGFKICLKGQEQPEKDRGRERAHACRSHCFVVFFFNLKAWSGAERGAEQAEELNNSSIRENHSDLLGMSGKGLRHWENTQCF